MLFLNFYLFYLEFIIKFFKAFTVPPADNSILKSQIALAIFSVIEPTQKQNIFLFHLKDLNFSLH